MTRVEVLIVDCDADMPWELPCDATWVGTGGAREAQERVASADGWQLGEHDFCPDHNRPTERSA